MRACPSCSIAMKGFPVGGVELDRCTFCKGLWFDGGELSAVLGKKVAPALDKGVTARSCAECQVSMTPAQLGGLRVEVCTRCDGIFLDEGELVAINGGQRVTVAQQKQAAPMADGKVKDEMKSWFDSLGV